MGEDQEHACVPDSTFCLLPHAATARSAWQDAALGPREDGSGATICSLWLGGEHFTVAQK